MLDLIDAHLAHIRAGGLAANTITDRGNLLRRLDRDLPYGLDGATVEELTGWLARDGWCTKTKATYHAHISSYFTWACDPRNPKLDWNPAASLIRPKPPRAVPRPCTTDQVKHAIARAPQPWRTYIVLAACAGLRCCEISALRREDVTVDALIVKGKGGKEREVPTDPQVWQAVEAMPAGLIARGRTADYISRAGRDLLRRIGLAGVTMHRFRAWFATWLLRPVALGGAGADLRTVQELLGHSSPTVTAAYTLVAEEQRRMAIRALPSLTPASA